MTPKGVKPSFKIKFSSLYWKPLGQTKVSMKWEKKRGWGNWGGQIGHVLNTETGDNRKIALQ